ncbi:thioredoxin family protein [Acidomonas methanolica]|uniref:thioredoxin family protein n=1 Tax=Acidomonas methanolica TaxID=437 RepID=UPI00211A297C|nr:thioredoxin family protein [Acidomonas methanolica]MCQ9156395.1 thioredoxin family protein [Acidomonas methanolica]
MSLSPLRFRLLPAFLALAALVLPAASRAQPLLAREGSLPALDGATGWLNTPPLTRAALRGKVVLVDFWTYSCINCLRELPTVEAWSEKYKPFGLVVIGVHAPEFAFEKKLDNIKAAISRYHVTFPVAVDNDMAIWNGFDNQYWPAAYLADAKGVISYHHFGEGQYDRTERAIQTLLREAGATGVPDTLVAADGTGAQAEGDFADMLSPETYIGYARARHFASTGGMVQDSANEYVTDAAQLGLNGWGLTGLWTVGADDAVLDRPGGAILFLFHARDLHLVLGPGPDGKPVRFRVTIDGRPPGMQHGVDTDAAGNGMVTGQRLYQLVRQSGPVTDHLFRIDFLDPGVQAFSFTFG